MAINRPDPGAFLELTQRRLCELFGNPRERLECMDMQTSGARPENGGRGADGADTPGQ